MRSTRQKWWRRYWPWNPLVRALVNVRFVIANILHKRTRLCWATLAEWALGLKPDSVKRCNQCATDEYTWCGRKR